MGGLPYDCISNPLGAVRFSFDKAVSSGLNPSTSDGRDWGALDLFRHFLTDNDALSKVPVLDASSVKYIQPNTLVRVRAMVQNMFDNEIYVGVYKYGSTWKTNKYSEVCSVQVDLSSDMRLWERRLLYCVPVPGLNSWAEHSEDVMNQQRTWMSQQGEKRHREEDDVGMDHMELGSNHDCQVSPSSKKMRDEGYPSSSAVQPDWVNGEADASFSQPSDSDLKSFSCLVKVYDLPESEPKLNEVFEFIGVLSLDSEPTVTKDESDQSLCEDDLELLPAIKVPRIHCIVHRKLGVHDFVHSSPLTEPNFSIIRGIRDTLLSHLTAVLGNDGVAAQFLLLHFLSQVHVRADAVAVGKLSLNLTGFSKETASVFGRPLSSTIKKLLPFTEHVPLTIEYLNRASFTPKKDYQANKLVSGLLQLAEGSHLTIDETPLQTGALNSTGLANARSLKTLTEFQQVEYDFQYYKMEMAADVQLLVLSDGKSNIIPADLVTPFQPTSTEQTEVLDETLLQSWRWYLCNLRSLSHTINPEMQKVVEDDLVAARQADRSLGTQDFSRLLTLGRLMSLSYGRTGLSMEHWQMVKELERLRKDRLRCST